MTDDDTCPRCGTSGKCVDISAFGDVNVRRLWQCCVPDPTAAELQRRADDGWLDRQRRLAADD